MSHSEIVRLTDDTDRPMGGHGETLRALSQGHADANDGTVECWGEGWRVHLVRGAGDDQ